MTEAYGDEQLTARLRGCFGDPGAVTAAATVTPQGAVLASLGAPLDAEYEIGSISKGVTGLLYADALARGEIGTSTTLAEVLPLGDTAVAGITLSALSTHTSGLPRLPASAKPLRKTVALLRHGTNPYGEGVDELLVQARGVKLGRAKPRYSNLGFELLGHAIASAAGAPYAELVRARVAEPLGIGLYVPARREELRPAALIGTTRKGKRREPWTGEAIGPAGGIRATIGDMARLASALLDGSAPGMAALEPVRRFGGPAMQIGAAWMILDRKGRVITWHNGGTGGFRSWMGLERATDRAVVLLSANSAKVDRRGFELLTELA